MSAKEAIPKSLKTTTTLLTN